MKKKTIALICSFLFTLQLPDLDGYEVTKKILEMSKKAPEQPFIVALSASSEVLQHSEEQKMHSIFQDFIPKPSKLSDFESVLKKFYIQKAERINQNRC
jgi:CheY-like chemotaxis protein